MATLVSKKILLIIDPVSKLNPVTDTSLYFLRQLKSLGHQCFTAEAEALYWSVSQLKIRAQAVTEYSSSKELPVLEKQAELSIDEFDLVLIRKEPPFDASYLQMCWFLSAYEDQVKMRNRPSVLLKHHEKMLPLTALRECIISSEDMIDTCVASLWEEAHSYVQNLSCEEIVLKPWLGHGGQGIHRIKEENFEKEAKSLFRDSEAWMIQPFEEAVLSQGDRRVFYLEGEIIGDFVRLPKEGGFVANLAQGGRAVIAPMTDKETQLLNKIKTWLQSLGISFAGLDLIGGKLTEVNITCPTGLQAYENLTGKNLAPLIVSQFLNNQKESSI